MNWSVEGLEVAKPRTSCYRSSGKKHSKGPSSFRPSSFRPLSFRPTLEPVRLLFHNNEVFVLNVYFLHILLQGLCAQHCSKSVHGPKIGRTTCQKNFNTGNEVKVLNIPYPVWVTVVLNYSANVPAQERSVTNVTWVPAVSLVSIDRILNGRSILHLHTVVVNL